ncbi:MAG: hypothetical protein AAGI88_17115 [Pseudomonadota bacterium]
MSYRTIYGRIRYTSKKPERLDQIRGRESFSITQQPDGVDVLHAHCEIDDEPPVVRDVVVAMDHDSCAPHDCHVRLSVGHRFEGSGWFRFSSQFVECETVNQRDGRITQRIDTDGPIRWMQCHPIVGDGLLMKLYNLNQGIGKQRFERVMLSSPDHRGATGPMLYPINLSLAYIGEEHIEVEAGVFAARHFQVVDTAGELPEEHPPYSVWCTADDDYILLKAGVAGYMQTHYELTELRIDEGMEQM